MALHLDIEPVRKDRGQTVDQRLGPRTVAGLQELAHRPLGPACQADQPCGMGLKIFQRQMRQLPLFLDVKAGRKPHQVQIPRLGLREQHDRRRRSRLFTQPGGIVHQAELAADNRLHPCPGRDGRKLQRREHRVGVGDRHRRHVLRGAEPHEFLDRHRAFQQRIFGMDAQVNESDGI